MEILATWGDGVGLKEGGSPDIVHNQVRVMFDRNFMMSKFWTRREDTFTDRYFYGQTYVGRWPLDEMFGKERNTGI